MPYAYSVDPTNIPPALSNPQLEYFILFAIAVAGKSAQQTHKKLDNFLERNQHNTDYEWMPDVVMKPFEIIRALIHHGELEIEIEAQRFGQYNRLFTAWRKAIDLDLEDLRLWQLEAIPGIGPKTARYIMLYADPHFDGVPLDTHILKYLKSKGYVGVPSASPPSGKRYVYWERMFQKHAAGQGKTVRQLDTEVWKAYNSKQQSTLK